MKAGMLNGHETRSGVKNGRTPRGERLSTPAMADNDRKTCLLEIAQEMGGPLNVVLGRMEYLLDRGVDRQTARSLKAIMSQAQQLVALRQQLLDEGRIILGVDDLGSPVSIEKGLREA